MHLMHKIMGLMVLASVVVQAQESGHREARPIVPSAKLLQAEQLADSVMKRLHTTLDFEPVLGDVIAPELSETWSKELPRGAHSQSVTSPLDPVPVRQRAELAARLRKYTEAFRRRDWNSLYDLASAVNKRLSDGRRLGRKTFAYAMNWGYDSHRLTRFTPIRTEMISDKEFNIYGCGVFPSGDKEPERVAVGVRAVREHGEWFFTAWDYFDPRLPCSNLSDPNWKPLPYLRLDFLPELTCYLAICSDWPDTQFLS